MVAGPIADVEAVGVRDISAYVYHQPRLATCRLENSAIRSAECTNRYGRRRIELIRLLARDSRWSRFPQ